MYEHKLVLFEKLGPGVHPCHWCGKPLRWVRGTAGEALVGDHLDNNRFNNDPANLVASCNGCNTIRARTSFRPAIVDNEPVVVTHGGYRTRAVELVCEECGQPFLAALERASRGTARCCSNSCAGKRGARSRWQR